MAAESDAFAGNGGQPPQQASPRSYVRYHLASSGCFTDVVVTAHGRSVDAHRLVLFLASPVVADLLTRVVVPHPLPSSSLPKDDAVGEEPWEANVDSDTSPALAKRHAVGQTPRLIRLDHCLPPVLAEYLPQFLRYVYELDTLVPGSELSLRQVLCFLQIGSLWKLRPAPSLNAVFASSPSNAGSPLTDPHYARFDDRAKADDDGGDERHPALRAPGSGCEQVSLASLQTLLLDSLSSHPADPAAKIEAAVSFLTECFTASRFDLGSLADTVLALPSTYSRRTGVTPARNRSGGGVPIGYEPSPMLRTVIVHCVSCLRNVAVDALLGASLEDLRHLVTRCIAEDRDHAAERSEERADPRRPDLDGGPPRGPGLATQLSQSMVARSVAYRGASAVGAAPTMGGVDGHGRTHHDRGEDPSLTASDGHVADRKQRASSGEASRSTCGYVDGLETLLRGAPLWAIVDALSAFATVEADEDAGHVAATELPQAAAATVVPREALKLAPPPASAASLRRQAKMALLALCALVLLPRRWHEWSQAEGGGGGHTGRQRSIEQLCQWCSLGFEMDVSWLPPRTPTAEGLSNSSALAPALVDADAAVVLMEKVGPFVFASQEDDDAPQLQEGGEGRVGGASNRPRILAALKHRLMRLALRCVVLQGASDAVSNAAEDGGSAARSRAAGQPNRAPAVAEAWLARLLGQFELNLDSAACGSLARRKRPREVAITNDNGSLVDDADEAIIVEPGRGGARRRSTTSDEGPIKGQGGSGGSAPLFGSTAVCAAEGAMSAGTVPSQCVAAAEGVDVPHQHGAVRTPTNPPPPRSEHTISSQEGAAAPVRPSRDLGGRVVSTGGDSVPLAAVTPTDGHALSGHHHPSGRHALSGHHHPSGRHDHDDDGNADGEGHWVATPPPPAQLMENTREMLKDLVRQATNPITARLEELLLDTENAVATVQQLDARVRGASLELHVDHEERCQRLDALQSSVAWCHGGLVTTLKSVIVAREQLTGEAVPRLDASIDEGLATLKAELHRQFGALDKLLRVMRT